MTDTHAPEAEVVTLASELIRIDTSNYGPDGGPGERKAAEYCAEKLEDVGIHADIYESEPGRASVVAHWEPEGCDASIPPLLIHGHTDVVPADPEQWQVDPFSGEVRDGCVWGRGAVDMKDFDAMLLSVVRARAKAGRPPRRPIRIVFTADEEAGGEYGSHFLADHHPDTIADCPEGIGEVGGFSLTVRDDLRLYLIESAEKGIAWLRLIADGAAGHGSMRNDDNAVSELARAVARIADYQWPDRLHPAQKAFLDVISAELGIEIRTDDVESSLAQLGSISRMIGATMANTANPTVLKAGYKVNVIPSRAEAKIDGRVIPGYRDEFFETIRELVGEKVRIEMESEQVPVETEYAGALVEAMEASLKAEDSAARTVPYLCSAGTDAKAWSKLGVKCFGFTPLRLPPELDFVSLFHGVDERVPVESLEFGCRVLDGFLDRA